MQWSVSTGYLSVDGYLGLLDQQLDHWELALAASIVKGIVLVHIEVIECCVPFVNVHFLQLLDFLFEVYSFVFFVQVLNGTRDGPLHISHYLLVDVLFIHNIKMLLRNILVQVKVINIEDKVRNVFNSECLSCRQYPLHVLYHQESFVEK